MLVRVASVKQTLWIGTADIKDVYVKAGAKAMPLLAVLDQLVKRGIVIRILHAKEPGPAFRDDFDKFLGCPVRCSEKQMLKSPIKLQN